LIHLEDLEVNWPAEGYELVLIEYERDLIKDKNSKPMSQPGGSIELNYLILFAQGGRLPLPKSSTRLLKTSSGEVVLVL